MHQSKVARAAVAGGSVDAVAGLEVGRGFEPVEAGGGVGAANGGLWDVSFVRSRACAGPESSGMWLTWLMQ